MVVNGSQIKEASRMLVDPGHREVAPDDAAITAARAKMNRR
jgi:hypothetical protein